MLPKSSYGSDFDGLINDIAALNPRSVLNRYADSATLNALANLRLSEHPSTRLPARSRPTNSWLPTSNSMQTLAAIRTAPSRLVPAPHVQFSNPLVQPATTHVPATTTRALPQPPASTAARPSSTRAEPPQDPPQAPLPSVVSQIARARQPNPPVPPRTPSRAEYEQQVQQWHATHGDQRPNIFRPFPLTPGSAPPTSKLCSICAKGDHNSLECEAAPEDRLPLQERLYRASVSQSLRRDEPRQTRPSPYTPSPLYRRRSSFSQPVELVEPIELVEHQEPYSYAYEYDSGNEEAKPSAPERLVGSGTTKSSANNFIYTARVPTALSPESIIYSWYPESELVVEIGSMEENQTREHPFKLRVKLISSDETPSTELWGTIDGGAMLCVVDSVVWAQIEHSFGKLAPSNVVCRMANGNRVPSMGKGVGSIVHRECIWPIEFEVLDSGGSFEILLGKNWLRRAEAEQIFKSDAITLATEAGPKYIENENPKSAHPPVKPRGPRPNSKPNTLPTHTQPETLTSPLSYPPRRSERLRSRREGQALADKGWMAEQALVDYERRKPMEQDIPDSPDESAEESWSRAKAEAEDARIRSVMFTEEETSTPTSVQPLDDILDRATRARARQRGPTIDTQPATPPTAASPSERETNPFSPGRVAEILRKVRIGPDLSTDQKNLAQDLVREFADVFALNLSEVCAVDFTELRLDIPTGATFPMRAGQKRMTEPQKQALYGMLDELESAGIIEQVTQDQVKAVSPISLVPKPGGVNLPTLEYLQRLANSECRRYGIPIQFPEAGFHEPEQLREPTAPAKWRLVQNFASVNQVTRVRSFPMGDLAAKQRAVAGHSFISIMDLQAGFHAIPIAQESVPYTGFYVDGRGHYVYKRMPFGLTSAPTVFQEMIAMAFNDLLGKILEAWMDDLATAADTFEEGMQNLRTIFTRCRDRKISLSASKTVLFMTEAVFAGARVSKAGIRPDLAKVRAILEWPEPQTILEVMSFIGLTNAYRSKIRDYARIAQPLQDYTRGVRSADSPKAEYRRTLRETRVTLSDEAKKSFARLKTILTSDSVLRAPVYNGRPFIVTTDGSKYGFGAVLAQEWEEISANAVTRKVRYPVAFASKRTSRTEERYIPFLLEFAALKFAFDEFESMIFGQIIELETDCKALADLIGNRKLNSTHERWREFILARDIRAVRHRPGITNTVCDALSRVYESRGDDEAGPGRLETVDPGWEAQKQLVNDLYHLASDDKSARLLDRFAGDPYFEEILTHLLFEVGSAPPNDPDEATARKRRAHRASGYLVDDGKIWLLGGKNGRAGIRVECIPESEGPELAASVHAAGGHFGRDMTVVSLQQRYHWPHLRRDATTAVTTCARCKNFGPRLLSALLKPITRARPFDLLAADYVSFPDGHGGFKNILLVADVYSRFLFAFPTRKPGTGRFTVDSLARISGMLMKPSSVMTDGGSHFDCEEVRQWADSCDTQLIKTPAYAPWTNGLIEGYAKLLSGRIKRLCAPDLGIDPDADHDPMSTPAAWPKHLDEAVAQLNDRILPSLGYSPRELLTGILSPERKADIGARIRDPTLEEVDVNMALTYAFRMDGYANALRHAARRKRQFDKKARPADFKAGDLVQKYDARLDETHSSLRKLAPRWSGPVRVVSKATNSYALEDLEGNAFSSAAHSRLLRPFIPSPGTPLDAYIRALRLARRSDPNATRPAMPIDSSRLPITPRPEDKLPLARNDKTQPTGSDDEANEPYDDD
ncbi:Retrovirus-related Pol polyprotein from transposon opus Includes: RecName: Full=Protease [Rhizoctonia solani AG-1 IB]|uniref:Pol protein n=1 Tax=Thanatephorus cucumeris (strain AG1-IB / isolate 7/3/14) TaxID=1108050 RepID=M5CHB7_THACB|nr:Retrovirus-related Pol polyprotein from transposon opus Includes: RecName: Full=Protease [Rhizoctonia solani AG-1 IB]